jgi:Aspartyl protease
MNTQITFTETLSYDDDPAGIVIFVRLAHAGIETRVEAKVDTGAAVCLFSREIGESLGLPIESGLPIRLNTLTGSIDAFGHEVTLQTGTLTFHSTIYFVKHPGLPRNLLGRDGWLRKSKLAVVDYDNVLYLSAY